MSAEIDEHGDARTSRDRELFDRIARDYARKDLQPAQRLARAHRLRQTLATQGKQSGLHILEVGCGAGFAASYLDGAYDRYVGIDHSEALIDYARTQNRNAGAEFHVVDVNHYKSDKPFDLIFMIGVLHHLADPVGVLAGLQPLLKPNGIAAVNEPQGSNPLIGAARAIRKRVDKNYSDDQVEYTRSELQQMFIEAGYHAVEITAQGLFSTPFAEVVTPVQQLTTPLSRLCCALDTVFERFAQPLARHLSWNLIATGARAGPAGGNANS